MAIKFLKNVKKRAIVRAVEDFISETMYYIKRKFKKLKK